MPAADAGTAPRRIGFDALRAMRNATGLGNHSRALLRSLRACAPSLQIELYSPSAPLPPFEAFAAGIDATLHVAPVRSGIGRSLWRTFRLGRAVARDNVDLYHGLSHEFPRDLPLTGIPAVVTFHDLLFETHPALFPPFDGASYRWRYRWSARHATALIAVSRHTRTDLVERYGIDPARITVIPPVRDAAFERPVLAQDVDAVRQRYHLPRDYALCVGTLETRKNQRVLVSAMAHVCRADNVRLVLIGRDGGAARAIRALSAELGLSAKVHLLEKVPAADLPALLRGAAVFLYPSRAEGFGMPVVEALSAGVPVVAAAGGHLDEAGGITSRYVAADDAAGWAAAITQVISDSALAARMREAGLTHARQFDGPALATRLLGVYDAVLRNLPLPADTPLHEAVVPQERS